MNTEAGPVLRLGGKTYRWIEDWAKLPQTEDWPHSGIVATANDEIVTFDAAASELVLLNKDGNLIRRIPVEIGEAHGITVVVEDGVEWLWLADASRKRDTAAAYKMPSESTGSRVLKVGLDGRAVTSLEVPPHPAYATGHYRPTCVAVAEVRFGGNGDIWVGDGYGESYVHHYDRSGTYLGSLSGEEGAGRFNQPHAVFVDRRRSEPELYIADRENARIQVYGLDGRFRRVITGFLSRPTWFATDGEFLVVDEYTPPRLTVLDDEDRLVGYLAEGPIVIDRPGWPNELDAERNPKRPSLQSAQLNSPHTVAVDSEGSLYVSEYLIGGRMPKVQRLS